jgi:hypothetical protein
MAQLEMSAIKVRSYCQVQIFSAHVQNPTDEPSNFFAFDFKGKIARFRFCAASTTIANDRSIFRLVDHAVHSAPR